MFGTDERGQAIQVGAVILFSFVVIAFSLYQASVVPSQNTAIEVQHNERVQSDMLDVRNAVLSSVSSGANPFVEVGLGTQYPARALAINPAPPSGLVRTTDSSPVTVLEGGPGGTNVSNDVCPGTSAPRSRLLTYEPTYNYLDAESVFVENTVAFTTTGDDPLVLSGQRFLVNNTVNLVPMRNEYQQQGTGSASVEPVPGGVVTTTVSDPVIEVPTELDTTTWQEILGDQLESGESAAVTGGDTLRLQLSGDYEIVCAPVGINGPPPSGARSSSLTPGAGDGGSDVNPAGANSVVLTGVSTDGNDVVNATFENTGDSAVTIDRARVPFMYTPDKNNVPSYTLLNGNADDNLTVRENFEQVDQNITIPAGGTTSLRFEFDQNVGDLFFGFSAIYESGVNYRYFIDVRSDSATGGDGSGGTSTSADSIEYNGDGGTTGQSSQVQFSVLNNGSSDVEITGVSVDAQSTKSVYEQSGGSDAGQNEVYIDSTDSGYYEAGPSSGQETNELTNGQTVSLTDAATVGAGRNATVTVSFFRKNNGDRVDVTGKTVTVVLEFADGTSETITFIG
ncbi:hypothetical protein [Halosegnis marinus]|uniref:Uncharacterized protein n=1 Tax=Halosegnis marinus TaxID=3034023 RepID=A0ABD5ZL62_9EURY|nr:hypothetical protein [Halosegnis sp. DT85]